MTASSVEFFPCRVRLMGLPRSAGTTAAAGNTSAAQQTPPRRPPLEKVQGVSRNLFGSPEPGEINQLFQEETRRHNSYVLQRYNLDIKLLTSSTVTQQAQKPNTNIRLLEEQKQTTQKRQFPTLIAHELRKHKQLLQKEECNLNRPNEVTPPNAKIQQLQSCGGVSKIVRRCCGDEASTPPSATCSVERQKPYARQSLLTETFNLRKNKICGQQAAAIVPPSPLANPKQRHSSYNVANAENLCLETSSLPDTHRNVQVLLMPKAMQAKMTPIDNNTITTTAAGAETTTTNATLTSTTSNAPDLLLDHLKQNAEDDDNGGAEEEQTTDDCTTSSSAENSPSHSNTTTFSLQLVVSTQDAVAATTSSASREHTHHA